MKISSRNLRTRCVLAAVVLALVFNRSVFCQTGSGWKGTTSSDFQTSSNWDNGFGNSFNLFVGQAWQNAGRGGSTTLINASNYNGYRLTFENISGGANQTFTVQGSNLNLFNFGGNEPEINNNSTVNEQVNTNVVFKSSTGTASINATGGNLTFGATAGASTGKIFLSDSSGAYQMNLGGAAGKTILFNASVDTQNGTNPLRVAITGNEDVTFAGGMIGGGDLLKQGSGTVLFTTNTATFGGGTNNVFIDQGTVAVGTGGSIGTTNGTTTGSINMGSSGTGGLNTTVNIANSGVTLANPLLVRYLQTGGKTLSGTFTSGSSTFSGAISLADHLSIQAANGGTLLFSGVISQAAGTGSATPGAGFVNNTSPAGGFSTNGPGVIINSGASSTGIVEYDNAMTYQGDTVVNSGTLQFNGAGSLANSTIRLGALGPATLNLISPTGSTLNVTVNVRSANSIVSASNTSGTSTLGGHFALDASATVQEASSTGTLAITQAFTDPGTFKTGTDIKGFTLTLTPTGTINISGDIYNSVNSGVVAVNGGGTVILSGTNSYSGGTTLTATSTLNINSATALGTGALTLSGTGIIDNTTAGAIVLANNNALTLSGGSLTFTGTKDLSFGSGALTISGANRTITVTNAGATLAVGAVNDAGGGRKLTKAGSGTLLLNGAGGTWTGGAQIDAGTLKLGATNAITAGNNVTVAGQGSGKVGTLDLAGFDQSMASLTLGGSTSTSGAIVTNSTGTSTLTVTGGVTYSSTNNPLGATISTSNLDLSAATQTFAVGDSTNAATDLTVSSVVRNGALTKNGTGTMTLSGTTANTYTGLTTVSGGTLQLNKTAGVNAIAGDGAANTGTNDVNVTGGTLKWLASEQVEDHATITVAGGTVDLNGQTETLGSLVVSSGTFQTGTGHLIGTTHTFDLEGGTSTINAGGIVEDTHVVIGGGTNTVDGGATSEGLLHVLSGSNGLEMKNGGTLTLTGNVAHSGRLLLDGDVTSTGNSTTTIASSSQTNPGTVDLNTGTRTFNVANGSAAIDMSVSAQITNGALTKTGAGTLELTGANVYSASGGTNVNGGTLLANNTSGSATGSGGVMINSSGTLGGIGSISAGSNNININDNGTITGATNGTVGALTLTAANVIFGGSSGNLATYVVDLSASNSDKLAISGNLNLSSLFDQISFQGTTGASSYQLITYSGLLSGTFDTVSNLPTGYTLDYSTPGMIDLVAVPETSTWVMGALALSTILFSQRRRFVRRTNS